MNRLKQMIKVHSRIGVFTFYTAHILHPVQNLEPTVYYPQCHLAGEWHLSCHLTPGSNQLTAAAPWWSYNFPNTSRFMGRFRYCSQLCRQLIVMQGPSENKTKKIVKCCCELCGIVHWCLDVLLNCYNRTREHILGNFPYTVLIMGWMCQIFKTWINSSTSEDSVPTWRTDK